jgi:HAD superfamily hydrolase (TIGR01459 family)
MSQSIDSYASLEAALQDRPCAALFLDAYGVFWSGNAIGTFPGAEEAMARLVASGKIIGILSNSTQLASKEIEKYAKKGLIQGRHFHFLLTSGDLARELFTSDSLPFPTPQKKYVLFCPTTARYSPPSSLFDSSPFQETSDSSQADFIYINVPHIDDIDQVDPNLFRPMVERWVATQLPMVCANPDLFAHEGSPPRPVVRQGAIAALYVEMGGQVVYIGKPFSQIFVKAFDLLNRLAHTEKQGVLMVGDTPETDIRGARDFGVQAALITKTGIMAERILQRPDALRLLPPADMPHFLIERFSS